MKILFNNAASTIAPTYTAINASERFNWLDWLVMVIYMVLILAMGAIFYWQSKKAKTSSSSYLVAKGMRIPTIVVALSIFATGLSSITFLSTPGLAFRTGWMWIAAQITFLVLAPYFVKVIIPFYRRIKESTVYAYLETRFNYSVRAISSISFIFFHIFRTAVVMYIPTLTLSLFIPVSPYLLLFIIAVVVIVSTYMGGFKGVMWMDAIQGVVFLIGICMIIIWGLADTDWGSDTTKIQQIFKEDQWSVSLASGGMFFIFASNLVNTLFTYSASQDIVQRYKTSDNITAINKSIWINLALTVVVILIFYGAGSILYTYYSSKGVNVDDKENAIDVIVGHKGAANAQLLAYFIISVLPMGISGLLVAAIFAASQSTVSSSLNALVNALLVDFVKKLRKKPVPDKHIYIAAQILILVFGALGFGIGALIIYTKQTQIISYFLGIIGLLASPVVATFTLGLWTTRVNWPGALTGLLAGFLVGLPIWILTNNITHYQIKFPSEYLVIVTFLTTIIIGYISSLIYRLIIDDEKITHKNLTNLTYWTRTKEFKELIQVEKNMSKAISVYGKFMMLLVKLRLAKEKPLITQKTKDELINEYHNLQKTVDDQTPSNSLKENNPKNSDLVYLS